MALLKTYDPKQVHVIVNGRSLTGFADGTFVKVSRDEDTFKLQVGADGEACRTKSNNRSGTYELTLQQSSEGNKILSDIALADETSNSGVVAVMVKDGSGNSLHTSESAWVQKPSDAEYGKDAGSRTWVLRTDDLVTYNGGN